MHARARALKLTLKPYVDSADCYYLVSLTIFSLFGVMFSLLEEGAVHVLRMCDMDVTHSKSRPDVSMCTCMSMCTSAHVSMHMFVFNSIHMPAYSMCMFKFGPLCGDRQTPVFCK